MEFNTALLHQSYDRSSYHGATVVPVYQVNAFAQ